MIVAGSFQHQPGSATADTVQYQSTRDAQKIATRRKHAGTTCVKLYIDTGPPILFQTSTNGSSSFEDKVLPNFHLHLAGFTVLDEEDIRHAAVVEIIGDVHVLNTVRQVADESLFSRQRTRTRWQWCPKTLKVERGRSAWQLHQKARTRPAGRFSNCAHVLRPLHVTRFALQQLRLRPEHLSSSANHPPEDSKMHRSRSGPKNPTQHFCVFHKRSRRRCSIHMVNPDNSGCDHGHAEPSGRTHQNGTRLQHYKLIKLLGQKPWRNSIIAYLIGRRIRHRHLLVLALAPVPAHSPPPSPWSVAPASVIPATPAA